MFDPSRFCVHPVNGRACDNTEPTHARGRLGHAFQSAPGAQAPVEQPSTPLWLPDDTTVAQPPAGKLWVPEQRGGLTSEEHFEERLAAMAAELLDTDGLNNLPALEPLVGDLLFMNSLCRIVGPSGSFKSFVLLDFAGHIGTGKPWHGHHVRQGTVVYLVAEGASGIRKRVRAWEKHYGMRMDNVRFLPRPVQAMDPEWDVLKELMRQVNPSLIIVDTQARVSVGVEENSNTEMGRVVERIEDLRRVSGACVSLVHHTGHIGEHGRGATAVKGALQSELLVSRKGDRLSNIVLTIKTGKQKDEEEEPDLLFGLQKIALDGEAKPDGRPVTSLVLVSLDAVPDRTPVKGSVEWIVDQLDKAQVPTTYGRERLRSECMRLEIEAKTSKLEDVARIRKNRANDLPPNLPPPTFNDLQEAAPVAGAGAVVSPAQTCPAGPGAGRGQVASDLPAPSSSLGRGQVGQPASICAVCGKPLDPEWADQGHDRHVMC